MQTGSKQETPKQETSEVRGTEDNTQQSKESGQASKPTRTSKEPITIESSSCVLKEVRTTKRSVSTAEGSELLVTLAVPSNARECRDTVTIDAPTFQLGKEATRPVSVTRPQEPYKARWLLDPEKPGRWTIAVETKRERVVVPIAVTTPLGFPAAWVQAGALIAGAAP